MMAPSPPVKMSYPCSDCNFEAQSARQLSRHRAVTHVENALKCVLCPFVTAYQTNLLRHRREVHGICGSKGNKSCKFCGFLSEDNETLIRHQLEVHRDILKSAQVKFAKELVSAGGEETPNESYSQYDVQSFAETPTKVNEVRDNTNEENEEDDDKNFWKEGFMDDTPNLFINLASLQQSREQSDAQSNWYASSTQASPQSHDNSINEYSPRSSASKVINKMPIPSAASNDDLPATRIRRQYTCNDCGFRTINPREFLYHRRDEHGQRLKIVECPYCVYACQYVQKLQRHLLLVHKLETSMTPPPEMSQQVAAKAQSKQSQSKAINDAKLASTAAQQQEVIPKIKVKLPTATSPAIAISEVSGSATSPSKVRNVMLTAKPVAGVKKKMAMQRQLSLNQKRANDKSMFAKKYHKCQTCGYMTNVHYLYKKHMKYHSAPKIKCEMCDFESPYSWNVDRHVRSHFSNGLFKCTKCSFACDKKQALTVHMTQHHRDRGVEGQQQSQQPQPLQSLQENEQMLANAKDSEQECEEGVADQSEANADVMTNAYNNSLPEASQRQLLQGLNRVQTTYVRQTDGKIVPKQSLLKKCKYCQFQTDTFAKLQKHETTFHPEKKYQCPLCEIKFENLVWLQRHLTHMHQEDSQANNIVNILDLLNPKRKRAKSSPTNSSQSNTLPDIPNDKTTPTQVAGVFQKRPLSGDKSSTQCQVCGYQTRWISELEKHMRVHTKERPFACPYCSFKSKWKGDLNRHIQKYHSRLPMPDLNAMEQQIQMQSNAQQMNSDNSEYMNDDGDDESQLTFEGFNNDAEEEENIDDIKMDETPLPDDYEERPLVFDDVSDGEEVDADDNENELQIDFEDRELVVNTDIAGSADSPCNTTTSGKVKMYRCSYCDFTCSTASRFHVHFVQHLNTKPFQCSVCGHRSNWEWDVTKHIKMKSQRDAKHVNAKAMLVHESGKRDYSKYNKYVVWVGQQEAIANNTNNTKIDFRAKRARVEPNDAEYEETEANVTNEADYEEDANYNSADPESIIITPDITFAVQGEEGDASNTAVDMHNVSALQPNVPYNSFASQDEKLLQCFYCEFKHKESKVMVSHLSSHAGVKPYRCRLCGFDSNWREVVVRHCAARHQSSVEDVEQRFRCTVNKSICKIVDESGLAKQLNTNSHLPSAVQAFQETHQSVRISGFKGSFTCNLCPFRAEKAFHMDFHVKRHQPSSGPFKCPHCPYWVNAKKSLVKHMLLHADSDKSHEEQSVGHMESFGGSNYEEDSDNELMMFDGGAQQGIQNYYNQSEFAVPPRQSASVSKNRCDSCPFVAGTKTQLLYHKQFHRPNRNATYKCPMCSYSVSYLHLLNQHMKVHYQSSGEIQGTINSSDVNNEEDYYDERDESDIPFTFVQIGNIKRRLFQCRFCPTTSKRRTYIYVHEQMHTQNTNENFKCTQCSYSTRDSSAFLAHFNSHAKTQPVSDEQQQQMKIDEEINKSRQAMAQSGNFSSPNVSVIDVNNIRHGNRRMFSYVCPDCPAAFKSPGDLKIHSAFHDADHPHPCPYCNYRAKNKPQLCKHLYVHTAEYIAKRANSYPDGTKLLISDSIDHMKRDLRSPLKESSDEPEKRITNFIPSPTTTQSLLKSQQLLGLKAPNYQMSNSMSSPPWSGIAKEVTGGALPKRSMLGLSTGRPPREQLILLEMSETKFYLEKTKTGGKHRFIYRCSHCPAVFMKVNTLTFHTSMHGSENEYKCKNCSYSSPSNESLLVHQQLHTVRSFISPLQSIYNHRCDRCPAAFSKRSRLEKHLTLHGLNAKWKCDKCDYAVHYAATLVKHRACHELNPDFVSMATEDNRSNATDTVNASMSPSLNISVGTSLNSSPNSSLFKAPPLPSSSTSIISAFTSTNVEKIEEKILYCCDRCPYVHIRKDAVQSHLKRHDQQLRNSRDGKQCPYCDYTCLQPSYLRDHILWHFEPPHDRKAVAFTDFNEMQVWKMSDAELKEKELFFRDRGITYSIRDRFEPHESDDEMFGFYNGVESSPSESDEEEDRPVDDEENLMIVCAPDIVGDENVSDVPKQENVE